MEADISPLTCPAPEVSLQPHLLKISPATPVPTPPLSPSPISSSSAAVPPIPIAAPPTPVAVPDASPASQTAAIPSPASLPNDLPPSVPLVPPVGLKLWTSVLAGSALSDRTRPASIKMIDGSAHASIPDDILLDSPPLWKHFIVGHFIGDNAPHIGKVHATVNRIWTSLDAKIKVDAQFLNPNSVLFKIEDAQVKARVLRRRFWHISDIPMVVQDWNPKTAKSRPDLSSIPIWVDFTNIPEQLFTKKGLMFLGDIIGTAQKLHPNTERCTRLDVARLLVEVNLEHELPNSISLQAETEIRIPVSYPWLPSKCSSCGAWGHLDKACSQMKTGTVILKNLSGKRPPTTSEPKDAPANTEQNLDSLATSLCNAGVAPIIPASSPVLSSGDPLPHDTSNAELTNLNIEAKSQEQVWTLVSRKKKSPKKTSPIQEKLKDTPAVPELEHNTKADGGEDVFAKDILHSASASEGKDGVIALLVQPQSIGGSHRRINPAKKSAAIRNDNTMVTRQSNNKKSSSRKA